MGNSRKMRSELEKVDFSLKKLRSKIFIQSIKGILLPIGVIKKNGKILGKPIVRTIIKVYNSKIAIISNNKIPLMEIIMD